MAGIHSPPPGYPPPGNGPTGGASQGQTPSAHSYPVAPANVANQLPPGHPLAQADLANRLASAHPASMYVNVPSSVAAISGQMQDALNLRQHTGMYAGFLNGVNHFNNCVINIQNNRPDLVPPMAEQPFRLWQIQAGPEPVRVPVPIQSLPVASVPAVPVLSAPLEQMLMACQCQLQQLEYNLTVLRGQLASMGQPLMTTIPPLQQMIPPYMIPMPQVIATIQSIPTVPVATMPEWPVMQGYPVQAPVVNGPGPFGQYYFEPFFPSSLFASEPQGMDLTAMQAMAGWPVFAAGFGRFVPPGGVLMEGQYQGPGRYDPQRSTAANGQ